MHANLHSLVYHPLCVGLMSNTGPYTHMLHLFLSKFGLSFYEILSYSRGSIGVVKEVRSRSKIDGFIFHRKTRLSQSKLRVVVDSTPGTKKRYIKKLSTTKDDFLDPRSGSELNHFIRGESHDPL